MAILSTSLATSSPPANSQAVGSGMGASAATGFGRVWADVKGSAASRVEVQTGDTLIGLVKAHYRQQGLPISETQAYRLAHQVASDNGITNPDHIVPGQSVDFARLQLPPLARAASTPDSSFTAAEQALASRHWKTASPIPQSLAPGNGVSHAGPAVSSLSGQAAHPVLDQTLARAVDKGFVPATDLPAVRSRILALADRYRFVPDDFARLTLMESGGMNPRASNGRCHGIIQFCDGPGRGAASVGFRQQPKAILGLSVYQQLSLVDTYFKEVGLGKQGPASLDDLYLTVLQPALFGEGRVEFGVFGERPQARDLHVGSDTSQAITRQSIIQGLLKNSRDKLNQLLGQNGAPRPTPAQVSQAPTERGTQVR